MLRLTSDKKIDIMVSTNTPSARCNDGDIVVFETLDCYDCSVTRQGERLKIDRMHNPATGPLFVEGAEAGDALKVEIIKITTRDWAQWERLSANSASKTCRAAIIPCMFTILRMAW